MQFYQTDCWCVICLVVACQTVSEDNKGDDDDDRSLLGDVPLGTQLVQYHHDQQQQQQQQTMMMMIKVMMKTD